MDYEECINHSYVSLGDEGWDWCGLYNHTCMAAYYQPCDDMEGEE